MKKKKIIQAGILAGILSIAAVAVTLYMQHSITHPFTDDATVKNHINTVSTQVNGKVNQLNIKNHSHVKRGDILFTLDTAPFHIALKQAQATLHDAKQSLLSLQEKLKSEQALIEQQKATLTNAKKTLERLQADQSESDQTMDNATTQVKIAQAALASTQAQAQATQAMLGSDDQSNAKILLAQQGIKQAELNLSYCTIKAPSDGVINKMSLRPGDIVSAHQPLFTLVHDKNFWIEANFKETQLARIKVGQPVLIKIDSYPNDTYHGKVVSFSTGSGSAFALLPAENATGNWVKVTQRVPVWISITNAEQYRRQFFVGQSAEVTVDTSAHE